MGAITCTVNANNTLTINSITGSNNADTWARFGNPIFQIFGGGTFELHLTVPDSSFQFNTSDPIDWGSGGQPSWITILSGTTSTLLKLQADSGASGTSAFTVWNAATNGQSISITLQSLGGSGAAGGTVAIYVRNDQRVLVGPMPAGLQANGTNVDFGFREIGEQELLLTPGQNTSINTLDWDPTRPANIDQQETDGQVILLIDNPNHTPRVSSDFAIATNNGTIADPTIITNPDESGP